MSAVVLLIGSGDIGVGRPPSELRGPSQDLAVLSGLATIGIALVAKTARIPVGVGILVITAVVALGGLTGLLAFYDSGGLGIALGVACIAGLWLILAGRGSQRPWSWDLPRRALSYLTIGVVAVPVSMFAGVTAGCTGSGGDDDLCGLGWVLIGLPATVLAWLLAVAVAEVAATARRRRHPDLGL